MQPPVRRFTRAVLIVAALALACGDETVAPPDTTPDPDPGPDVYVIPVVVHVIHQGEPVGVGSNLSKERIERQIRLLNDDFRRRPGTRGHNTHPDGGDARMEFVLAQVAPDGAPTDGIVRIDTTEVRNPTRPGSSLWDRWAYYSYWDPERYVNVWTLPMLELTNVVLGMSTGPETDLPGSELQPPGEPVQAAGILINAAHFGESDEHAPYNLGRTLTYEMGHYFGLLHTWGRGGDCEPNDYCEDTPPVSGAVSSCPATPPPACDGRRVMVENYMNFTPDGCMNTFTRDQIARMHYVLENSPRRRGLPL